MTTNPAAPARFADLTLADPDGVAVPFASLAADLLVVILVRYFGCLPCQDFVEEVDAIAADRLPAGARVIAIGGSADYQARWLRDDQGVQMPLLLDADQQVRDLVAFGNLRATDFLKGRGVANYVGALRKGLRPQRITKDTVRSPGVALLGPDFEIQWTYEGSHLGDYPSVDDLVAQIQGITDAAA